VIADRNAGSSMESKYEDEDNNNTYQVCDTYRDSKTEHLSSPPQIRGLGLDLSRARSFEEKEELECDRNPQEAEVMVSLLISLLVSLQCRYCL
jgi:hypothetical protein